jgi:hypothetical protein
LTTSGRRGPLIARVNMIMVAGLLLAGAGCAPEMHYKVAKDIAFVSFDENVAKGATVGPMRGGDCTWFVLGHTMGSEPTLDRALLNARQGRGESVNDAVNGGMGTATAGANLRYMTDVSTDHDGFNAGFFGKRCLIVKATGYK